MWSPQPVMGSLYQENNESKPACSCPTDEGLSSDLFIIRLVSLGEEIKDFSGKISTNSISKIFKS